eukprot:TRINITY_DN2391_c1_g1_i1.p1 TRINITY_DN2391_c1_g1~~TRINITY_DN2391_c1_g1_i1.p1  ORF type:complete len:378 (-),score=58.93 TRINITY_DN2391_c1_g1_i1:2-1135(-)
MKRARSSDDDLERVEEVYDIVDDGEHTTTVTALCPSSPSLYCYYHCGFCCCRCCCCIDLPDGKKRKRCNDGAHYDCHSSSLFRYLLPDMWDTIFHFGWFSDFRGLLYVSKWFNSLVWRHLRHLDFEGDTSSKYVIKTLSKCHPNTIRSLLVTSYGTLHIDTAPDTLKHQLTSCHSLNSLSSLVIQRWSLSPSDLIAKSLPHLTHLTIISASSSNGGDLGLFSNLRSLTLRFVSEPMLSSIVHLKQLHTLNIGNLSEIRPTHETIEYTSKNGREVTDATFHYVLQFGQLRRLYLGGLGISDRSLERLATTLTTLNVLSLTWCQRITDMGLGHLTSLRDLRELETWHSGVTKEGVASFVRRRNVNCKVFDECLSKPYDI